MNLKEIFINKTVWNQFNEEERQAYVEKVFQHYRKNGFPYFSTTIDFRQNELKKIMKYDYKKCLDVEKKLIRQSMHGLSFCWSFHPYHYEIQCNKMKTPYDVFHDDVAFRKVIEKRMKMGDNISDNGIRKMLKVFTGTQCVSNFRPTAAACIYEYFTQPNDYVWDMSFGFGGRALGAFLTKRRYLGTDPSTKAFEGVKEMCNFLQASKKVVGNDIASKETDAVNEDWSNFELLCQGSEEPIEKFEALENKEVFDLCFTSPPYFDCEKYSLEESQSYRKYPEKEIWLQQFLGKTFENCFRYLKIGKKMIINIQNVKTFPNLVEKTKELAISKGFQYEEEWGLFLSSLKGGGYKTEPILIFSK